MFSGQSSVDSSGQEDRFARLARDGLPFGYDSIAICNMYIAISNNLQGISKNYFWGRF